MVIRNHKREYELKKKKVLAKKRLVKCGRCKLEWYYSGRGILSCECPKCRGKVKLK